MTDQITELVVSELVVYQLTLLSLLCLCVDIIIMVIPTIFSSVWFMFTNFFFTVSKYQDFYEGHLDELPLYMRIKKVIMGR